MQTVQARQSVEAERHLQKVTIKKVIANLRRKAQGADEESEEAADDVISEVYAPLLNISSIAGKIAELELKLGSDSGGDSSDEEEEEVEAGEKAPCDDDKTKSDDEEKEPKEEKGPKEEVKEPEEEVTPEEAPSPPEAPFSSKPEEEKEEEAEVENEEAEDDAS